MLLILLMIVQSGGQVDKLDFARRIQDWMNHGFKELGDYGTCVCAWGVCVCVCVCACAWRVCVYVIQL